ncbi:MULTISPECIES: hypothetical protein [unclassified Roseibium]|uniref:hypothetical protein n=1 Tax=unclassified Roseibium TaxID=2629323 RepID=UPI00273D72CE|nr:MULTISPECIES: hypothetical protein [unclassified Roseibium]
MAETAYPLTASDFAKVRDKISELADLMEKAGENHIEGCLRCAAQAANLRIGNRLFEEVIEDSAPHEGRA